MLKVDRTLSYCTNFTNFTLLHKSMEGFNNSTNINLLSTRTRLFA